MKTVAPPHQSRGLRQNKPSCQAQGFVDVTIGAGIVLVRKVHPPPSLADAPRNHTATSYDPLALKSSEPGRHHLPPRSLPFLHRQSIASLRNLGIPGNRPRDGEKADAGLTRAT